MSEYKNIPVAAAVEIAEKFTKDVVVILAWSHEHHQFHTVTYGVAPKDKTPAAKLGEMVTAAAGADMTRKEFVEDFRKDYSAAKQAAMKRAIEKHLPALSQMAGQIISPKNNTFSKMVADFENALALETQTPLPTPTQMT